MLLLPLAMGVEGVLWAGPLADGISFIAALVLIVKKLREIRTVPAQKLAAAQA